MYTASHLVGGRMEPSGPAGASTPAGPKHHPLDYTEQGASMKAIPSSVVAELAPRIESALTIDGECWIGPGINPVTGYSSLGVTIAGVRQKFYSHRVMYTKYVGPIPNGLTIDHFTAAALLLRYTFSAWVKCQEGEVFLWRGVRDQAALLGRTLLRSRSRLQAGQKRLPDGLCKNPSCVNPEHLEAERAPGTCRNGHSITDPSTVYVDPKGHRNCRECTKESRARKVAR